MEETVICKKCLEVYQEGAHDPLLLPCGHTFCRSCVNTFKEIGITQCPTCGKRLKKFDAKKMPAIQSVLNLSLTFKQNLYGVCSEHGNLPKSLWCLECNVAVCGVCALTQLHNGHETPLAEDYMKKKKAEMRNNIILINKAIMVFKDQNSRMLGHLAREINNKCISFKKNQIILNRLKIDLEKAYRIDSLTNYETELNQIKQNLPLVQFQPNKFIDFYNKTVKEVNEAEKKRIDAQKSQPCNKMRDAEKSVNIRISKLDFQDNRLLLHSFLPPVHSQLSRQMPTEVFLELSVGGRCLGRVYIQLQCHLKQAGYFLITCLGNCDHSWVGTSISMVENVNEGIEAFAFAHCIKESKDEWQQISTTGQKMVNNVTDPTIEGTMAVIKQKSNESQLCILTKYPSHYRRQPFGKVSSGLDVVQNAMHNDPNVKVTITNCGIVVNDLGN